MAEPYIGEIRMVGFNYAPQGWALCNGQMLPISQYTALFSLLGTTYGGNGTTTFALPDLRGRVPINMGQGVGLSNYVSGQIGGSESVSLTQPQMPAHNHSVAVNDSVGSTANPTNAFPAEPYMGDPRNPTLINCYAPSSNGSLAPSAISMAGGSQPHENRQPYLVVNFIIALNGIFPPRS